MTGSAPGVASAGSGAVDVGRLGGGRGSGRPGRPQRRLVLLAVLLAALLIPTSLAWAQGEIAAQNNGVGALHGSFNLSAWDRVDAFSGNAMLTFTDAILPGNGGFDLVVRRIYNTKDQAWVWDLGIPKGISLVAGFYPIVVQGDGQKEYTSLDVGSSGVYYTTSFWRYTSSTGMLETPGGVRFHFEHVDQTTLVCDYALDRYNNRVDITWTNNRPLHVVQTLGNGETREIDFTYGANGYPTTMTANGRVYSYSYDEDGHLTTATSPAGVSWQFEYTYSTADVVAPTGWEPAFPPTGAPPWHSDYAAIPTEAPGIPIEERSIRVITPTGGWVRYVTHREAGDRPLDDTLEPIPETRWGTIKLWQLITGDAAGTIGTWQFSYGHGGSIYHQYTTIEGRDALDTLIDHAEYDHNGYYAEAPEIYALAGLDPVTQRTDYTWTTTSIGRSDCFGYAGECWTTTYGFLPDTVTTTLGGRSYAKTYTYASGHFSHFGQPTQIDDTGDFSQTTKFLNPRTFTSPYLADAFQTVEVDGASQSLTATIEYDALGFVTARTAAGVRTEYTRDPFGNVASQTAGTGTSLAQTTSFVYDEGQNVHHGYSYGAATAVKAPQSTLLMTINVDGTVASRNQDGRTTTYGYDAAGRLTSVQPPVGNPTLASYGTDESITMARGAAWTTTCVDGLGRPASTFNSAGVRKDVEYDAMGRVRRSSLPYPMAGGTPSCSSANPATGWTVRWTAFQYRPAGADHPANESPGRRALRDVRDFSVRQRLEWSSDALD